MRVSPEEIRRTKFEFLPIRVHGFSELIEDGGFERGSTILIAAGTGAGKTTFSVQAIYNAALAGERCVYISFEELPEKICFHMAKNYGWDMAKLIKDGKIVFLKVDPLDVVRRVEASFEQRYGELKVDIAKFEFPFKPDWVVIDSLSVLSIAFKKDETYRLYLSELFAFLRDLGSVNILLSETDQSPTAFSKSGVEEFLADGVIVFYNIKEKNDRQNALEILKLRSGKHVKKIVPYSLTKQGFVVNAKKELNLE